MIKTTAKLTPRGNSLDAAVPKDVLEASGLRDDGVIEIGHAAPVETRLDEAFEWSLGRYGKTYADLAR